MNGDVNWNDVALETDGLDHLKQKHKADRERGFGLDRKR
jgi:hypothetical protein